MICKDCNKDINKINSGRRNKRNKIIYVNEEQRRWQGAKCPDCWSKHVYAKRKFKEEIETFEGFEIPVYHTNKKCPKCLDKLELSRWKKCFKCEPPETRPSEAWYESYSVAV